MEVFALYGGMVIASAQPVPSDALVRIGIPRFC